MDPVALEFDQEEVEPERLGQERDPTRGLAEVGPGAGRAAGSEDVLDVDHADHGRQVVLAERIPGVPGLAGDPEVVLDGPRQAQVDDVRAGDHHPAGGLLLQVEDVLDHHPLVPREVPAGHALGDDVPQLLLGVGHLGVIRPAQADQPEGEVARVVEQPDEREEQGVERDQDRRGPERDRLGRPDRQALGSLLP